jgi:hypothetical protein
MNDNDRIDMLEHKVEILKEIVSVLAQSISYPSRFQVEDLLRKFNATEE